MVSNESGGSTALQVTHYAYHRCRHDTEFARNNSTGTPPRDVQRTLSDPTTVDELRIAMQHTPNTAIPAATGSILHKTYRLRAARGRPRSLEVPFRAAADRTTRDWLEWAFGEMVAGP